MQEQQGPEERYSALAGAVRESTSEIVASLSYIRNGWELPPDVLRALDRISEHTRRLRSALDTTAPEEAPPSG